MEWISFYDMRDYCYLCEVAGSLLYLSVVFLVNSLCFHFASKDGFTPLKWWMGLKRAGSLREAYSYLKENSVVIVWFSPFWVALIFTVFSAYGALSLMFSGDPPSANLVLEAALKDNFGQCIRGEYASVERAMVGKDVFYRLRLLDGKELYLGGYDSKSCFFGLYADGFFQGKIAENFPHSDRVEVQVCWV